MAGAAGWWGRMRRMAAAGGMAVVLAAQGAEVQAQAKPRDPVRFLIGADPQFTYNDYAGRLRSPNTFRAMATFLANCTDCSRMMVIAGDLSHDGKGMSNYAEVAAFARTLSVKVLDGLGNHDVDPFEPEAVAFHSESELRYLNFPYGEAPPAGAPPLMRSVIALLSNALGWSIYDVMASTVDSAEPYGDIDRPDRCDKLGRDGLCARADWCGSFALGDAHYCYNPALYYTAAIRAPYSTNPVPSAYVVQLHNYLYSVSATTYLERVRTKLKDAGELSAPVILVAHQLDGADMAKFDRLVTDMNIAAILVGHYGCEDRNVAPLVKNREYGHCDRANTIDDLRWSQWTTPEKTREAPHPNVHGPTPPIINVNAMLHNIFWSVQLRPDTHEIAFQRFNLGDYISTVQSLTPDTYYNNVARLRWLAWPMFNFPPSPFFLDSAMARAVPPSLYVCNYNLTGKGDDSLCAVRPF